MARVSAAATTERVVASSALGFLGFAAAIAILYFARAILIPFSLALLFTFVLTPLVIRLQSLRLGRAPSVLLAAICALAILTGIGWMVTTQLIDLAAQLPQYKGNIHRKFEALQGSKTGVLGKLTGSLQQIADALPAPTASKPSPKQAILAVRVVDPPRNVMQYARELAGPLLRPLENAAIVVIFTMFMLFERESLRNRLLRLVGQGQLSIATKALGDAADRVSRFLLMQLVVNSTLGAVLACGLWLIGVPNALLFGAMAALLRFIPYVGILAAAILPVTLALAVFNTWVPVLLTLALFAVLEITVANVLEPWLYGAHTGISSLAILVAAVFWASLWGPAGLILSTPLTVCLVVIGRHVPHLQFLDIMLGDEPVLLPAERFYQRLLALDVEEARSVVQDALKSAPLVDVYDQVIVPALSMAEQDKYRSELRDSSMEFICSSTSEIVQELASALDPDHLPTAIAAGRVLCFGASDAADEVTAAMLSQLLDRAGLVAMPFPLSPPPAQVIEQLSSADSSDTICICALPPLAAMHARSLTKEIRARFPDLPVLVCLWTTTGTQMERMERLVGERVVTSLATAVEQIGLRQTPVQPSIPI